MATQQQQQQQQQTQTVKVKHNASGVLTSCNNVGSPPMKDDKDQEDMSRSALAMFRAKEEEIEKKKMEVRDKVFSQLGRVEESTRRLAEIRQVIN